MVERLNTIQRVHYLLIITIVQGILVSLQIVVNQQERQQQKEFVLPPVATSL